ncbi:MAG TPA: two-component regulator propeller domain-containing protein [Flavobacterium sp.]|nr:two-component regulator propeller domain-containing protein [Flavobacterium sp.]
MKNKRNVLYSLIIMLAGVVNFAIQAQQKNGAPDAVETKNASTSQGPKGIVRTIKQDRKGNIWITSWEGVFKYDGKSFANITSKVSSARFFSVLEDSKGNFWFASIGSGVYYYDGKSFRNFTTKDGLANDRVGEIYEDKTGNIWFGTGSGASRYDGKSFQNFKMKEAPPVTEADSVYTGPVSIHTEADSVHVSAYQKPIPEVSWMHNDVNAIIEDKTGKFWFGTRGNATVYDGKIFTTITNKDGKPFTNVRSIIKDKKGYIWLGGYDGLWRYDGKTFTNFTHKFVGYIYEDKKGNIWTSSESANAPGWVLSRYDEKTLSNIKPTVTEITNKPMIFGILEAFDGSIWFGDFDGVHRYDGNTITSFNGKKGQK